MFKPPVSIQLKTRIALTTCVLVISLTLSATGCRLGNFSEEPVPPGGNKYKSIELLYNEAKGFETIAILDNVTDPLRVTSSLANIPSVMSKIFTEPVVYLLTETNDDTPYFYGINENYTLQTAYKNGDTSSIDASPASSIYPFFGYEECQTQNQVLQVGTIDRTQTGSITYSDGSSVAVVGKLNLDVTYLQAFAGDCSTAFARLSYCYQDGNDCSREEQIYAAETLDLYVKLTNVLNIADLSHVIGLAYKIRFQ